MLKLGSVHCIQLGRLLQIPTVPRSPKSRLRDFEDGTNKVAHPRVVRIHSEPALGF